MRISTIIVIFICSTLFCRAQEEYAQEEVDSLIALIQQSQAEHFIEEYEAHLMKEEKRFNPDGIAMIIRGGIQSWTHQDFYKLPGTFPHHKENVNLVDYAPAASPLALAWILKASKVPSRSKFRRMSTANVFSIGMTVGLTQMLKHTVREWRPDKTSEKAFPSGHTAIAFMSASILSREYGHVSPWITVGAYTSATATSMLRIKHNTHWMNDIAMGAGIGMVSANLGYLFSDLIWGEDGINRPKLRKRDVLRTQTFMDKPSGIRFVMGSETGNKTITLPLGDKIKTTAALTTGLDASWYITPKWALEATGRYSTAQAKYVSASHTDNGGTTFDTYHANIAGQYSMLVPYGLGEGTSRFGIRAQVGTRYTSNITFNSEEVVAKKWVPEIGVGFVIDMLSTKNYSGGFTFDYNYGLNHPIQPHRVSICSVWKVIF